MQVVHDQYSLTTDILNNPDDPGPMFARRRAYEKALKGQEGYVLRGDVIICPDGSKLYRDVPYPGIVRISPIVKPQSNPSVEWLKRVTA